MSARWLVFAQETLTVSGLYIGSFWLTSLVWMPLQNMFFAEFVNFASLLHLPFGVYVLAAWLMGWRSALAILPGVIYIFWALGGMNIILPNRIISIIITICVAPAVFHLLALISFDVRPRADKQPCWICVMLAGLTISVVKSVLINIALGSTPSEYIAYMIGDMSGLFFLMLALMLFFRNLRSASR
ncbi:hypothetical protein [Leisingera caerulea]|uniref:hypothetical protein n=1 Tax=Leisingera caerulea TaxID=506591 RepID=UPI0021A285B0|nr:hypothetical protein [Leisingera caerulea]UWQ84774.1 hypothetical protein K3726_06115 [Leisingera caerulea]